MFHYYKLIHSVHKYGEVEVPTNISDVPSQSIHIRNCFHRIYTCVMSDIQNINDNCKSSKLDGLYDIVITILIDDLFKSTKCSIK